MRVHGGNKIPPISAVKMKNFDIPIHHVRTSVVIYVPKSCDLGRPVQRFRHIRQHLTLSTLVTLAARNSEFGQCIVPRLLEFPRCVRRAFVLAIQTGESSSHTQVSLDTHTHEILGTEFAVARVYCNMSRIFDRRSRSSERFSIARG